MIFGRRYDVTKDGPFESDWALKDQIRRAAISVMSNIAPQEYFLCRHYEIVRRILYRLHWGTSLGDRAVPALKNQASGRRWTRSGQNHRCLNAGSAATEYSWSASMRVSFDDFRAPTGGRK
jgi:hypothetical protein